MSAPRPTGPAQPTEPPSRPVALFVLGVALVLLVSSVTWFGSGRTVIGILQLVVALVVAGVGAVLYRRSRT